MCNRYRPASVTLVRDVFGFTLIEDSYPAAIGPLSAGLSSCATAPWWANGA